MSKLRFTTILMSALLFFFVIQGSVSFASSKVTFIHRAASKSYEDTLSALKLAISKNGMMVMGELDQQKVLLMAGLKLEGAHAFFVGNPVFGKKLFSMNPAVGVVLPLRVFVWVNQEGKTEIGYFQPSELISIIDPALKEPATMLDKKFLMIVDSVVY